MHRMLFLPATCPKAASWGVMCSGCGRRTICCAPDMRPRQRTLWARSQGRNIGSKSERQKARLEYGARVSNCPVGFG